MYTWICAKMAYIFIFIPPKRLNNKSLSLLPFWVTSAEKSCVALVCCRCFFFKQQWNVIVSIRSNQVFRFGSIGLVYNTCIWLRFLIHVSMLLMLFNTPYMDPVGRRVFKCWIRVSYFPCCQITRAVSPSTASFSWKTIIPNTSPNIKRTHTNVIVWKNIYNDLRWSEHIGPTQQK